MESDSYFRNLSPLDHRYRHSNPELFDSLSAYLSESANVEYCLRVEVALLGAHLSRVGLDGDHHVNLLADLPDRISAAEIYEEEETTHHNVRALVNVLQRHLPSELQPFVHLGATSVDILDTAQAARTRDVVREVLLPILRETLAALIDLAEREAETPQIGRTHGRHAVPVTFGYAVSEYVARLGKCIPRIEAAAKDLRGKLSGAVGASNAIGLIVEDPIAFESDVLRRLDLAPAEYATQVVEPEHLLRLLAEINTAFGVIANLADDLRHLQRSEIDEVREFFSGSQVGSSTMPQKRNPWNCEHVKSLWKAFSPRVVSFYLDQISEHQRDLSNSASGRFVGEFIAGFAMAISRMERIVESLYVNRERMKINLAAAGEMILAEPLYILLAQGGHSDAHEAVRRLTLESEEAGKSLGEVLRDHPDLFATVQEQLSAVGASSAEEFFSYPERYSGLAAKKTMIICKRYRELIVQGDISTSYGDE